MLRGWGEDVIGFGNGVTTVTIIFDATQTAAVSISPVMYVGGARER